MARYLIDANLPYRFSLWQGEDYLHVFDHEIWSYARNQGLTIVSKDADFSDRVVIAMPPRVIHLRVRNMRMRDFYEFLTRTWIRICILSESHKLVRVYSDHFECIE